MNIEKFEKHTQAEFEQYRPETDHDQIWENIEPHLKKKKRRPFILWFRMAGMLMLLGLVWFSGIFQQEKPQKWGNYKATQQAERLKDNHLKSSSQVIPSNSKDSIVQHKEKDQARTLGKVRQESIKTNLPAKPMFKPEPNVASSEKAAKGLEKNQDMPVKQSLEDFPVKKPTEAIAFEPQVAQTPSIEPVASVDSTGIAALRPTESDAKAAKEKHPSKARKHSRIKPHKRKKSRQTIALHSGVVFPLRVLQQNDLVEANPELLEHRKTSEKMLEGFSSAIHYSYATKKGLLFRGGLEYRRLNEKFIERYEETKTTIQTGVLTQTLDASGQVIAQTTGPKTVTSTRIYSNTAYNRYQFLNVPLGLGFQKMRKRSQWEVAAGLDLNLWFQFDGTLYYPHGSPKPLTKLWYSSVYKRKAGLGMWASYGYSRNLTQNIRWQLLAKTSLPFHPLTSENYPLVQKYFTVGVQGGLVFNLFKASKSKHKKRS